MAKNPLLEEVRSAPGVVKRFISANRRQAFVSAISNAIIAGLAALVGGGRWIGSPGRITLLVLLIVVTLAGYYLQARWASSPEETEARRLLSFTPAIEEAVRQRFAAGPRLAGLTSWLLELGQVPSQVQVERLDNLVVEAMAAILPAGTRSTLLVPDEHWLTVIDTRPSGSPELGPVDLDGPDGATLRDLVRQTGLLIEDPVQDSQDLRYLVPASGQGWNSALRIPVSAGQRLLGLLCADAREAKTLDESHLQMMIAISNLFALGMRHADRAVTL
jgi:transcriptional regulator with GAF, ATPase, and Fis domain